MNDNYNKTTISIVKIRAAKKVVLIFYPYKMELLLV